MRTGRPVPSLILTAEEKTALEQWIRRSKTGQALATRSRIVLACSSGKNNSTIASELRLCSQTVGKWRTRFFQQRLDGLLDEPQPGAPRSITDAEVEMVVTLTLESMPSDATHWSTRSLARRTGLSQSAISRI